MRHPRIITALLVLVALPAHAQISQPPDTPNAQQHGRIVGTVVNDEGELIKGAMLCTRITNPDGAYTTCGSTKTDENGVFEIPQVLLGKIDVYAQAAGELKQHVSSVAYAGNLACGSSIYVPERCG